MWKPLLSIIAILLSVSILLAGCGASKSEANEIANQEQFLKDMAEGIKDRLSKSDKDTSSMTQEEVMAHYQKLVQYELNQIEKYENKSFENQDFDRLAHLYISACTMQLEATKNYKNAELYSALWDGGRVVRSGLITTLYDRYDLPITAEQANEYRTTTNIEYSVSGDTDYLDLFSGGDGDVVLDVGDLAIIDTNLTFEKASTSEYDRFEYSFTVKNDSTHSLESISLQVVITDLEGNILGTDSVGINNTVDGGKSAVLSSSIYLKDYSLPFCIVPDYFYYDGNGDYHVYNVDVDAGNATQYTMKVAESNDKTTEDSPSVNYEPSSKPSNEHTCIECGKNATNQYKNPFSGLQEYYCNTHYQEILDIMDMMESDVGSSNQSKHTCEECSKEGTHVYDSFTGQREYYCTEHYEALMDLLDALGIG